MVIHSQIYNRLCRKMKDDLWLERLHITSEFICWMTQISNRPNQSLILRKDIMYKELYYSIQDFNLVVK